MSKTKDHKTIGIVLSAVPGYSETFFRNKIKGLQDNGFEVVLFVDYRTADDHKFPCKIVAAPGFDKSLLRLLFNSFLVLIKVLFIYPRRSYKLYQLDRRDGIAFNKRIRNIIVNQFLLSRSLDWLHFGFGMLAVNRENVAQAIGAKMAVSFRGFDLYLSPLKHKDCYDSLFTKEVKYHVLSHEMKSDLIDYNISSDMIKVIPPAINIDFFKSENKPKADKIVKLVTVARLHWKKGLEYTLDALAYLKKTEIKFHYTIIGDGSEYERLVFAAYQSGIKDHVTFAGKMPQVDVKKHLEHSDMYLQYSIQEGFCNSVIEAQAMGLLCIVSDAEGLSENVLDGKTGWVIPKRQPKLLAEKITDVIEMSNAEKQLIRKQAISRVQKDFNLGKQNGLFLKFYKN